MTKDEIRQRVWSRLQVDGALHFPGRQAAIPNFEGAERAGSMLCELPMWRRARVVLMSPDPPQAWLRRRALSDNKIVYLAAPKLKGERCFIELDPNRLGNRALRASSLQGALKFGKPISPADMKPIDLMVCGSIAVTRQGARLGPGGGYCDLGYALLRSEGRLREYTPILTTVHSLQVVDERIPMRGHDIPVDFIATPTQVIATPSLHPRPRGVIWEILREERIHAISLLRKGRRIQQSSPTPRQL